VRLVPDPGGKLVFIVPDKEPNERQRQFIEASKRMDALSREWIEADRKRSRRIQKRKAKQQSKSCETTSTPTAET
jgi:hypothetical protein